MGLSGDVPPPVLMAQSRGRESLAETMKKAAASFGQSDYTAAIALWTQVITSNPGIRMMNEALVNRAKAYLIVGQPLLALSDLEASRYQPNETKALAELWLLQGSALLQNKQYALAIAAFAKAEKLQPPNPMLMANRSVAYQSLGNMAAARADLLAAISLQPNLSNYFNLAVLERLNGNYASCYKLLSEIIGKPTLAELFGLLGDEISSSSLDSYEVKHTRWTHWIQRRRFQRLLLAHAAGHVGPHVPVAVLLSILPIIPLLCV